MVQRELRLAGVVSPADAARTELDRIAARAAGRMSGENFPVALRLLPRRIRDQLARVYGYARFVDDVGDEASGDRLELLNRIEADVRLLGTGQPTLEPVRRLLVLVRGSGLAVEPFADLVEANRRDQLQSDYETFDDLLDYCRLSAAPIGRIVLGLAGVSDPDAALRSDRVCAALQVLEHCQDVGEDARAGRIYLPGVDRRAAGVADSDLLGTTTPRAVRRVVAQQVARAETLLADGAPLVRQLRGWARLAVLGYVAGGRATAHALRAGRYDVLAQQLRPTKLSTVRHAALLVAGR
jgi:squalene synthase HpnC